MFCIYRITNLINGKTYIGQHRYNKTPYDDYMGSGKTSGTKGKRCKLVDGKRVYV